METSGKLQYLHRSDVTMEWLRSVDVLVINSSKGGAMRCAKWYQQQQNENQNWPTPFLKRRNQKVKLMDYSNFCQLQRHFVTNKTTNGYSRWFAINSTYSKANRIVQKSSTSTNGVHVTWINNCFHWRRQTRRS